MNGRLGAGSLARFALARSVVVGLPIRVTQLVAEVLGNAGATAPARVTQVVVEVLGVVGRERFRVVMI